MTDSHNQTSINLAPVETTFNGIYVSKNGNDANGGRSPSQSKLTINAALTTAAALSPSITNLIAIQIIDSGFYTEDITGISDVIIDGPNATVIGAIVMPPRFHVFLHEIQQNTAGAFALTRSGDAGVATATVDAIRCTSTALGAICLGVNNQLVLTAQEITVEDGIAIGDATTGNGALHFNVGNIQLTGAGTPVGVARAGVGESAGRVTHIENTGASVGARGLWAIAGQMDVIATHITCPVAFRVETAGELALIVSDISDGSARQIIGNGILLLSEAKRDNMTSVVAPGVGDDYADGYRVGSLWLDTALVNLYTCTNPAAGAAVWIQIA